MKKIETYEFMPFWDAHNEKVIGDINYISAKKYERLSTKNALPLVDKNYEGVFLDEDLIIKTRNPLFEECLWKEFKIGRGLENIGLNVPKMKGIYFGNKLSILFMNKLNLEKNPHKTLKDNEMILAKKQYEEQIEKAIESGFHPDDVSLNPDHPDKKLIFHNCGFSKKEQKLYLFDFGCWSWS